MRPGNCSAVRTRSLHVPGTSQKPHGLLGLDAHVLDLVCLDGGLELGGLCDCYGRCSYNVSQNTLLHYPAADERRIRTSTTKSRLSPRIINSTFAGMPILYICVAPVLTAFMNISWNNIISNTRAAFGQLEVDAANWTSGPVSLSTLQRLSKGLEKSESLFAALAHWEEACTCYEAAINSALLVVSSC